MSTIKFNALTELPSQENLQEGSIIYLANGSQYVVSSSKELIKITDTVFVNSLPETGIPNKVYVLTSADGNGVYAWIEDTFKLLITKDSDIVNYGINIKASYSSMQDLIDSGVEDKVNGDLFIINSGDEEGYLYRFNNGNYEFLVNIKGNKGEQGERGEQGEKGERGERGLQGIQGNVGATGAKGEKGDKGDNGDNGLSAYELALENGFIGDLTAFLDSLKGETGLQGIQGERGEKGETGATGAKGETGERGEQGIQGIQGEQGVKGDMGDSFVITKSYTTIIEMQSDFDNVPENSFVIISSDEPDTDPDNAKVFFRNDVEFRFIAIMRGLRGEKGDQGLQGIQGIQGERGEKGEKGDTGERGEKGATGEKGADGKVGGAIKLKGILNEEFELPSTGVNGDAYWIGTRLYIWTDDSTLIAQPGFLRGNDLQGIQGLQGLQGVRGEKGEGVTDIGTAELLTQNKTIKEAINELFQYGNDVKQQTVNALLSKDNTLPIDNQSTWQEVISAISTLKLGYKINGNDYTTLALETISEGDFIMRTKKKLYDDVFIRNTFNSNGTRAFSTVTLSDGRVIIVYAQTVGNLNNVAYASLLKKEGTKITVLSTIAIDSVSNSGFNPRALLLKNDTVVVALSSNESGTAYRAVLKKIKVVGNTITNSGYFIADSTANSGLAVALYRLSDTRFILARKRSNGVAVSVYTDDGSASGFTNHGSEVVHNTACTENLHIFPISESERRYGIIGGSNGSYSNGNGSLVAFEVEVNSALTTLTLTRSNATHISGFNGAYNTNYLNITRNGEGRVIVSCRDTSNENRIRLYELWFPTKGELFQITRFPLTNSPANSGGTATDNGRRNIIHSMVELEEHVIAIAYRGTNKIGLGLIDLRDTNDVAKNIEIIDEGTITEGGNGTNLITLIEFKKGELAVARLNGSTVASDRVAIASADIGLGYKKYKTGYDELSIAIARNDARIGDNTLMIRRNP